MSFSNDNCFSFLLPCFSGLIHGHVTAFSLTPADVTVGAHFEKKFESHAIRKGDGIRLRCKALGEKPVSISWSKDRVTMTSNSEPRYVILLLLILQEII